MLRKSRCTLCLSMNRKTVNVSNTNLQQLYEILADFKITNECWMCYICHTKLQQCHQLQQLAIQTRGLINNLRRNKKNDTWREFKPIVELSLIKTQIMCSSTSFYIDESLEHGKQATSIKLEPLNEDVDPIKDKRQWNVPCVDQFVTTPNYVFVDQQSSEDKPNVSVSDTSVRRDLTGTEEYLVERRSQTIEDTDDVQRIKFEFQNVDELGVEPEERREDKDDSTDAEDHNDPSESQPGCHKRPLSCDVCNRTFESDDKLSQHARSHAADKLFTCDICFKTFSRKDVLKTHMVTHKGDKPFSCDVCQKRFAYKNVLKNHLRTHTGEKPFSCDVCQKRFSRVYHLRDHMKTHSADKLYYTCHICSKQLLSKRYLNIHVSKHLEDQQYSCNICSKQFEFKTSLYTHAKRHLSDKPFACDVCPLRFKTKSGMQRHTETHGSDKPFSCDYCSWKFLRKADLVDHTRTHTGEKPFSCNLCERKFSRQRNLRVHLKTHTATGEKPFSCDICMRKYVTEAYMKAHKSICHNVF